MQSPTRILIVDDDIAASRLLELGLERACQYHVRVENHSGRAVATAHAFQPDLVILDIVMPELDGGDVAAQFKQDPGLRHLPIIFLTSLVAHDETLDHTRCRDGSHYLAKPTHVDTLIRCIECLVAGITPEHCREQTAPVATGA